MDLIFLLQGKSFSYVMFSQVDALARSTFGNFRLSFLQRFLTSISAQSWPFSQDTTAEFSPTAVSSSSRRLFECAWFSTPTLLAEACGSLISFTATSGQLRSMRTPSTIKMVFKWDGISECSLRASAFISAQVETNLRSGFRVCFCSYLQKKIYSAASFRSHSFQQTFGAPCLYCSSWGNLHGSSAFLP